MKCENRDHQNSEIRSKLKTEVSLRSEKALRYVIECEPSMVSQTVLVLVAPTLASRAAAG